MILIQLYKFQQNILFDLLGYETNSQIAHNKNALSVRKNQYCYFHQVIIINPYLTESPAINAYLTIL